MTDSTPRLGEHYIYDSDAIGLFGSTADQLHDRWYVNGVSAIIDAPDNPESVTAHIQQVIADDTANGKLDQLAQLHLSHRYAIFLCLEGTLRPEHFSATSETADYIDLTDVAILGHNLTIRILANAIHDIMTTDREGNML